MCVLAIFYTLVNLTLFDIILPSAVIEDKAKYREETLFECLQLPKKVEEEQRAIAVKVHRFLQEHAQDFLRMLSLTEDDKDRTQVCARLTGHEQVMASVAGLLIEKK